MISRAHKGEVERGRGEVEWEAILDFLPIVQMKVAVQTMQVAGAELDDDILEQRVHRLFVVKKFLLATQSLAVLSSPEIRSLIRDEAGNKG